MEKEFYQGAAGVPPPINLEGPSPRPSSLLWTPYMNPDQDHLFYGNRASWEKSTDQFNHFDSALTSLVSSSPGASNFGFSGDIVELIGKLGNICSDSGEDSPPLAVPGSYIYGTNDKISTKPNLLTNPRNPIPRNPSLMVAEFSGDPGFAQRAAKFSRFGTRSFNGQTGLPGLNSSQSTRGANPLLPRVASTPSLNNRNPPLRDGKVRRFSESSPSHAEFGNNSQEDSSFSGQIPSGNSRKRKAGTRSKAKEITPSSPSTKAPKVVTESEDNANAKRSRPVVGNENGSIKGEEDTKAGSPKPPEPSKDYIHVRARRGQATDSHSLAERVRREKISERMKLLQDLVPGCNKVTGKALMLDEIINYVQSLQRQVEFLSMKLSRVDLRPDFGKIESALRKDMFQTSSALAHTVYSHSLHPYDQQPHQSPPLQADPNSINSGSQCSVDAMGKALSGFIDEALPQLPAAGQDDLQSIVQMGYIHNPNHGSIQ